MSNHDISLFDQNSKYNSFFFISFGNLSSMLELCNIPTFSSYARVQEQEDLIVLEAFLLEHFWKRMSIIFAHFN